MPNNLLKYSSSGEPIGLNISAVKNFVLQTTAHHADLRPYLLVHYKAKTTYLEELAKQLTPWQIIIWTTEVIEALTYVEKLTDCILEADETTYGCDLRNHQAGEVCPNRINLILPDPEDNTNAANLNNNC